ncbi:hypothetical protein AMIS_43240 [Actinoplanes missouriensis 431]|uniref:Uncharacterized protein n=1 Tax=Actinoplanes missouriensis (strain ATCC 14538 / DSM 43046 / CBS 188.64 / JCM 3121 / NBRC 102363 / NCIMB 12654 / NRRL B-3342 / UNCC 431) TaxID=512565 RepID=I0H957_ACTM4|nr:hypothetical protein [Actinoplanes missouriensis]BAL89544.1 hypothetical protein AMIS_43240 [Actinoplanes missouriensis 431]
MTRILGIELRRSAALGSALTVFVVGTLLLYFAEGIAFATGWMQLAMTQRLFLALLWPIALAAGAWQASREHRSKVGELFASTPRPIHLRVIPILAAMTLAVTAGYLAMGVAGGLWIVRTAAYVPAQAFVVTAVGVLSLVAAVWLGLAVGRLLPWRATAPVLAVAGLGLLLGIPAATRPRGWLALVFSPITEMNMPDAYTTVPARASAAQALWMAALAVTALLLFASRSWRGRVAALLPVVVGAALAITVMPHQNRYVIDAIDPVARELVCEDRVCVSRVHSGLLPEIAGPAREALTIMAKLPGAPTRVHEDTTTYRPDVHPEPDPAVALLRVEVGTDGHVKDRDGLLAEVVAGAFRNPPSCDDPGLQTDQLAAAYWLIGREPVISAEYPADVGAEIVALWSRLRELPQDEAQSRVVALRAAGQRCAGVSLFGESTS